MTRTSPAFPGASAVTSVPSACVTAALQPKLTDTCEGSTCFGGNASQVLTTCRLSVTGSIVNALLVAPFAVMTTSVAAGVEASPMLGLARESSYGIWTVMAATRHRKARLAAVAHRRCCNRSIVGRPTAEPEGIASEMIG